MRRAQPARPKKAHGVTAGLRGQLIAVCGDDLIDLRDKVGFDTLCRRGELVALLIEDFGPAADGRYTVLVRRAKNDPEGARRTAKLSNASSEIFRHWLEEAGIYRGPLLRPVYRERVRALYLEPLTVGRVLKKLCSRAGIDVPHD